MTNSSYRSKGADSERRLTAWSSPRWRRSDEKCHFQRVGVRSVRRPTPTSLMSVYASRTRAHRRSAMSVVYASKSDVQSVSQSSGRWYAVASFWRQPLTFTVVMEEQSSGRSPEGCSHSMHFGGAQSRYSKLSFMPARHVLHVSAWLMNSSDAFASVLTDHLQRCTTRRI